MAADLSLCSLTADFRAQVPAAQKETGRINPRENEIRWVFPHMLGLSGAFFHFRKILLQDREVETMADLKTEYTDLKGRTHTVEHILVPSDGGRERVVEDLVFVLTGSKERFPA